MIAALYVERNGCYYGLPNVDPWDKERDARLYAGPWPVVAHPPCERWCRLAGLVEARWGHKRGEDGGCFASALAAVRCWGGVLEHPAYSDAWPAFELAAPPTGGGWVNADFLGGWTCYVEQGRYGHDAKKATWLYAHGTELPSLRWGCIPDQESKAFVSWCGNHVKSGEVRPRVGKAKAARSPLAFRDLLISIAESAKREVTAAPREAGTHAAPPSPRPMARPDRPRVRGGVGGGGDVGRMEGALMEETPCAGQSETSEPTRHLDDTTPSTPTAKGRGPRSCVAGLQLLTESRAQTWRRCKREERLRYVEGLFPRETAEALRFGTLGHHALEEWWRGIDGTERLGCALAAIIGERATPESDPYEIARLEALVIGYDLRWKAERYEVLGVELEFRAPLVNPETGAASRTFQRAGKLDVMARDGEGDIIIEHKFSGEDIGPGSTFWARLRIGGQSAGYIRGAEALGYKPRGVLYDVVAKPRLKPLQANTRRAAPESVDEYQKRVLADIAENPDKYYQRGLVVRLDDELAEHDQEMWQLGQEVREHHRLGLAPRNTDACHRYGSMCCFFPLCAGESSPDEYQHAEWVHPELIPKEEV